MKVTQWIKAFPEAATSLDITTVVLDHVASPARSASTRSAAAPSVRRRKSSTASPARRATTPRSSAPSRSRSRRTRTARPSTRSAPTKSAATARALHLAAGPGALHDRRQGEEGRGRASLQGEGHGRSSARAGRCSRRKSLTDDRRRHLASRASVLRPSFGREHLAGARPDAGSGKGTEYLYDSIPPGQPEVEEKPRPGESEALASTRPTSITRGQSRRSRSARGSRSSSS